MLPKDFYNIFLCNSSFWAERMRQRKSDCINVYLYRFDGHDSRLTRQLEAVLMVMEAFDTYGDKFKVFLNLI